MRSPEKLKLMETFDGTIVLGTCVAPCFTLYVRYSSSVSKTESFLSTLAPMCRSDWPVETLGSYELFWMGSMQKFQTSYILQERSSARKSMEPCRYVLSTNLFYIGSELVGQCVTVVCVNHAIQHHTTTRGQPLWGNPGGT